MKRLIPFTRRSLITMIPTLRRWTNTLMFLTVTATLLVAVLILMDLRKVGKNVLDISKENQEKLSEVVGDYPIDFDMQQNVLREPPVFHLDEPVDVEATFRNTINEDVTFAAAISWILVEPDQPIEVVQFGLVTTLQPGCKEYVFNNNPPEEVKQVTRELFASGHKRVTWRLSGDNVIVSPEKRGQKQFNVDQFTYIPDDQPLPLFKQTRDRSSC